MTHPRIHPFSLLAGLALGLLALVASAQKAPEARAFEYRMIVDVEAGELTSLAAEGWEFAGYLGQSPRGTSVDETLWRRSAR